jgi:uncharacterized protein YndB with AHSA1/START domain
MVERLSRGPVSVSELARPLDMSLSAVVQHLAVLEAGGLVRSEKKRSGPHLPRRARRAAESGTVDRRATRELGAPARPLGRLPRRDQRFCSEEKIMTQRSTEHATFVIERTYDAAPARVFSAWAVPAAKRRWFSGPDGWDDVAYELDFRVGGHEISRVGEPGGPVYSYEAHYHDVVPNERIAYAYTMDRDQTRISVSLATVEFEPAGAGTRLIVTEQGAFLDGHDKPEFHEHGTKELLDSLDAALRDAQAASPTA